VIRLTLPGRPTVPKDRRKRRGGGSEAERQATPDSGPARLLGENAAVPAAPDDRRILVFAGGLVVLAGLAIAALLFLVTGGTEQDPSATGPIFLGLEPELAARTEEGGPSYIASPFGEHGFWLDLEAGRLVALDIVRPGTRSCIVKWRATKDSYISCDGARLETTDLARFDVSIGSATPDAPADSVYVDLRLRESAPNAAG